MIHNTSLHRIFFSLLLLFLPTQLGYHFWPEWATVLGRRVDYVSPTIFLTDVLIILTLASWVLESVSCIVYGVSSIKNVRVALYRIPYTLYALLVFAAINIFSATSSDVAVYKWLKVLEFAALGYYIVKTKVQLSAISLQLSVGILYSSLIAIGQFLLQRSIGGPLWWLGERTFDINTSGIAKFQSCQLSAVSCQLLLRPYATFPHPNVLGGYIAAMLPLIIIQFSNSQILKLSNTKKIFYLVTLLLGIIALVLTFSRSAIAVGTIAMLVTLLKNQKSKIKNLKFKILIPMVILLVLGSWLIVQSFRIDDESIIVRQQLNAAAIKLWQRSPLVGVGLGNFLTELPKILPVRTIYFLQPVHNIYLLVLAEIGIVGLALFLWMLWRALETVIRDMRYVTRKTDRVLHVTYHLSLVTLLILGLVDHYPLTLQQGQLLLTTLLSVTMSAW